MPNQEDVRRPFVTRTHMGPWYLNLTALIALAIMPAAISAGPVYEAITIGHVDSGPFAQPMGGLLYISWDPDRCGLANSILQQGSTASYSNTAPPATPPTFVSYSYNVRIAATLNNLQPNQPNTNLSIDGNITLIGLVPPLLYGPFTAEQRGVSDPYVPPVGPDRGVVAETHVTSNSVDVGPVSIANPPVPAPPLGTASLATSQHAGPHEGVGMDPIMMRQIIHVDFHHSFIKTLADGTRVPGDLGMLSFDIDMNNVGQLITDYDTGVVLTGNTPNGSIISAIATKSGSVMLNPGESVEFINSMSAQAERDYTECVPEPSAFGLMALGILTLLWYCFCERRQTSSLLHLEL